MLKIDIITLFPEIFFGPFASSIVGRAIKQGIVEINAVDLRKYAHDKRGTVDDTPYGGGPGMLMKPDVIYEAVQDLKRDDSLVVLTSPSGRRFDQAVARELKDFSHMIIICGHYEGVDERVKTLLVDREISIGDYILTNGNLAAMVMTDAIVRLLPGALGDDASSSEESFEDGLLEYPQYTKPPEFMGLKVPDVLLSGDHEKIARWRKAMSIDSTVEKRPDLI